MVFCAKMICFLQTTRGGRGSKGQRKQSGTDGDERHYWFLIQATVPRLFKFIDLLISYSLIVSFILTFISICYFNLYFYLSLPSF